MLDVEIREELARHLEPAPTTSEYWHYTSAQALIAILQSHHVRLGCHAFMNDPGEGGAAVSLLKDCWEEALDGSGKALKLDPSYIRSLSSVISYFDYQRPELPPTFLFSLTKLSDSLSQWSRYGADGAGVALLFKVRPTALPARSSKPWSTGVKLLPVYYDSSTKPHAIIRRTLTDLFAKHLPRMSDPTEVENILIDLIHYLKPVVKHQPYAEEQEYRLVTRTVIDSSELYDVTANRFGFAPFVPLPFGEALAPVEIMLGPKLSDENDWSIRWLCRKHGYDPRFSRSALAYR